MTSTHCSCTAPRICLACAPVDHTSPPQGPVTEPTDTPVSSPERIAEYEAANNDRLEFAAKLSATPAASSEPSNFKRFHDQFTRPMLDGTFEFTSSVAVSSEAAGLSDAAKICEEIETDKFSLYKGRPPYTGGEAGRADTYVNGESDGAGQCAISIRAALAQQVTKGGV